MAQTVEELIVRLTADNEKLKAKLKESSAKTESWSKSINSHISGQMKMIGSSIAAAFTVGAISQFFSSAIAGAREQAKADRELLYALNNRKDLQIILLSQAEKLRQATGIDDADIIQVQKFNAAQGRTLEQNKKITQAAVDLSAVMGIDVQSAAQMLNATYEGMTRGVSRLDSRIKDLSVSQLKNGEAVDIIAEKYKGFGEKSADAMTKFQSNWDEFMENVGKNNLPMLNLILEKLIKIQNSNAKPKSKEEKFSESIGDLSIVELEKKKVELEKEKTAIAIRYGQLRDAIESKSITINKNGINVISKLTDLEVLQMTIERKKYANEIYDSGTYIGLINKQIEALKQKGKIEENNDNLNNDNLKNNNDKTAEAIRLNEEWYQGLERQVIVLEQIEKIKKSGYYDKATNQIVQGTTNQFIGVEQPKMRGEFGKIDELQERMKISDQLIINYERLTEAQDEFTASVQNMAMSSIKSWGDFANAMTGYVRDYLVKMYAMTIAEGIFGSFKNKDPLVGLIEAGLVSAGIAMLWNNLIPSFSTGAYVSSPTYARIGDTPGGEWVLNTAQMQQIAGSGNQKIEVYGVIKGKDIYLTNKKGQKNWSR